MAFGFKNFIKGIRLVPVSSTNISVKGDIEVLDASGKLNYFNGTSASPLVTEAHSATLTNKIIDASLNTISNIANANISAGAAIAYSKLNLVNSIVNADINASAAIAYSKLNLSNSILNADINASAAIAYSKLNLVGSIVNADINASAAIARNKLASGSINHVVINDGSGVLSSEATLAKSRGGSGQDNSSITFPGSGVLVTEAGTQTLSNKTFSDSVTLAEVATPATPASGNGKIYFKSDGFLYQLNDDGTETKVGAGSGGINYITNNDAESNTTGWAAYADAAGVAPVDGTGGSPSVTITRSVSSPLRGTGSFLLTKDASNRQGQGVSYDFTIADADKAKPLAVSFNYTPASGTFVAGDSSDIRVYLYDVTNAQVIQPAPYTIQGGSGSNHRFLATFQTASNSNSYRLILHIATTSTAAYTFKFDDVSVGPQMLNYGSPVTDWVSYTPTIGGLGTGSATSAAKYRRTGDSLEISASVVKDGSAGTGTATVTITIPSGLSIDSTKVGGGPTRSNVGSAIYTTSGFTSTIHSVFADSSANNLYLANSSTGNVFQGQDFGSGRTVNFTVTIPISGWSSTVEMSNDTDTRVVTAQIKKTTTSSSIPGGFTKEDFQSTDYDTHGAFSTSTDLYTAPVSGYYNSSGFFTTINTVNEINFALAYAVDGGASVEIGRFGKSSTGTTVIVTAPFSFGIYLRAGQTLELRRAQAVGVVDIASATWTIERLTGPSAIAASETIAAQYRTNSGTLTNGVENTVVYTTKDFDTHGSYNSSTGVFTVPSSGIYDVTATALVGGTEANNNSLVMIIRKNGAITIRTVNRIWNTGVDNTEGFVSGKVQCVAGDTLDIRLTPDLNAPVYDTTNGFSIVSINRI